MNFVFLRGLFLTLLTGFSGLSFSSWELDDQQSDIHFLSIKKSSIAEIHSFTSFKGVVKDEVAEISILLSSAKTGIAIRDERLLEHVFEVKTFPKANIRIPVKTQSIKQLKEGETTQYTAVAVVKFHGQKKEIPVHFSVTRLINNQVLVQSIKPAFVSANDFLLVGGINKLKELASLPSIDLVVPVTFRLIFNQK